MKNYRSLFRNLIIIALVLFGSSNKVFGQEKINLSGGIGLPDLLNVGVRYQLNQSQFGISSGIYGEAIALTGDYYQHLLGTSKFSKRRPFYTRVGLTYIRDEDDIFLDQYLFLVLRVGRDFNLSKNFGIQFDVGVPLEILHDETKKADYNPSPFSMDIDWFIPALGLTAFYRL